MEDEFVPPTPSRRSAKAKDKAKGSMFFDDDDAPPAASKANEVDAEPSDGPGHDGHGRG
eukprot:CAMPEP_0202829014 /NCGR_PEP_ID=MMETSP1389-20130828/15255_1 /ASSEMBLY_ACC=CAM_ASM_000865 /TAXON_ID=302021 /ORGANISM="Rhodomonas sp., Strain CCMP768" /LENGTH=58 /DNA_ID=CAMNT_0049502543 /DNA_START=82 /DNA_END=255 /DNA_ORIENTATION=-